MTVAGGLLLVSASGFGWGSLGKLRLILDQLGDIEVVFDPDSPAREDAADLLGADRLSERDPEDAAAALVVNDPVAAERIEARGVPVVYVDSLPYLWAGEDEVPRRVSVYCAQRWPGAPDRPGGPLAGRREVRWIEPIVPRARGRRGGAGTVVSVGGLHSDLAHAAVDSYLRLVLPPLVKLLASDGRPVAAVCGNLPDRARRELEGLLPGAVIGPQTPAGFEATLRRADLLMTSPGSTTLLQAAALGLPTLLLPPQNLSQILNAEIFADPDAGVAAWPDAVLRRDEVEQLRPKGEVAVIEHVYAAIDAAAASESARSAVAASLAAAFAAAPPEGALTATASSLGWDGARQVARRVRQALLAPYPVPAPLPANP